MIRITIYSREDDIEEINLTGHAGFADHGFDIVCAAVSSQVISIENSLQHLLGIEVKTEVNEIEGGFLHLTLPEQLPKDVKQDAQLLLRHLDFALEVLAENYPEFIQIKRKNLNP